MKPESDYNATLGSVKGTWTVFKLISANGIFKKTELKNRLHPNAVTTFLCLHNTNLHQIELNETKGYFLMYYNESEKTWKLCFAFDLSKTGSVIFEWKGLLSIDGIPAFLKLNLTRYLSNLESHFKPKQIDSLPIPCYFVNLVFNPRIQYYSFMHRDGVFPQLNRLDGCFDQSMNGPCCIFIPRLTWQDRQDTRSIEEIIASQSMLPKTREQLCWKKLDNDKERISLYDVVFVPTFKLGHYEPYKCMAVVCPCDLDNSKGQAELPTNWKFQTIIEYEYNEKLPDCIPLNSFREVAWKFAISMEQRLAYEGSNLRIMLITTQRDWNDLIGDPFEDNQKLIKYGKGREVIIATSRKDPIHIPGVYVSGWSEFEQNVKKDLKDLGVGYDFCATMYSIVKSGYKNRLRSKCNGVNQFYGFRSGSRASMTPATGPRKTSKQQYFRQSWANKGTESIRLYLESTVRNLPVQPNMEKLAYTYCAFIGFDTCDKLIWTSGIPNGVFSFSNETHCDDYDFVDKRISPDYVDELKTATFGSEVLAIIKKYIERTISYANKIPMPTTCAYLHCWEGSIAENDNDQGCPSQYFDYPRLGLMKKINHENTHWMLPGLIDHRTTLCVVVKNGIVYLKQHPDIKKFTILAWGRSGGSPESRRNAANRRN